MLADESPGTASGDAEISHSGLVQPEDAQADIASQADSVFARILSSFEQRGIGAGRIVRTRVYVKDMHDFAAIAAAHAKAFGASAPASTMVQLEHFPLPGTRIMAEATAARTGLLQPVKAGVPIERTFGFSKAMRVGDYGYATLATAWNAQGKIDDPDDYYGQARIALRKLFDAAAALGGDASNIVHTRIFIRSFDGFEAVARAHREVFGEFRPAATLMVVQALFEPAMAVAIEGEMHFAAGRAIQGGSRWESWFGFTRAYLAGSTLHVSGTTGSGTTTAKQVASIADTLTTTLSSAGHAPADVTTLRVLLIDDDDRAAVRSLLASRFGNRNTTWAFITVPRLATAQMRVEVEAESVAQR